VDGDDRVKCPICETLVYTWPPAFIPPADRIYTAPDPAPVPRFVLHRYPGPILCAGSGLPAKESAPRRCLFCGHAATGALHRQEMVQRTPAMWRCQQDGCACEYLVYAVECGLCGTPVETRGEQCVAVAHARPGT